nr:MAG TPA: hypothetical protein [Caudoviricetes sp.]
MRLWRRNRKESRREPPLRMGDGKVFSESRFYCIFRHCNNGSACLT